MAAFSAQGFQNVARDYAVARDPDAIRRRLLLLERTLEGLIRLPGGARVGVDGFIGLVPVAGDLISAAIGSYIVWEARNLGMSRTKCTAMMARVGWDAALGAVPLVGDVLDFCYRSNTRNVKVLLAHLEKHHPGTQTVEGTLA